MITVCFIENIDPLGVHTGDSFCSAPMLTISQEVQDRLKDQAFRIVESIGVIGGQMFNLLMIQKLIESLLLKLIQEHLVHQL